MIHSWGPRLVYWAARLWLGTVRVEIEDLDIYRKYMSNQRNQGHIVVALWHRNAAFAIYYFKRLRSTAIMVSKSRDGDFTTRVAEQFGHVCFRGSSSRGGTGALKALIDHINQSPDSVVASTPLDGPQGPARKVKKGLLLAAKLTDTNLLPMAWSGTRVLTFNSWDKTMLPLPFSKVVFKFHEPYKIPATARGEELERLVQYTENALNQLSDQVDERCGYTTPSPKSR